MSTDVKFNDGSAPNHDVAISVQQQLNTLRQRVVQHKMTATDIDNEVTDIEERFRTAYPERTTHFLNQVGKMIDGHLQYVYGQRAVAARQIKSIGAQTQSSPKKQEPRPFQDKFQHLSIESARQIRIPDEALSSTKTPTNTPASGGSTGPLKTPGWIDELLVSE